MSITVKSGLLYRRKYKSMITSQYSSQVQRYIYVNIKLLPNFLIARFVCKSIALAGKVRVRSRPTTACYMWLLHIFQELELVENILFIMLSVSRFVHTYIHIITPLSLGVGRDHFFPLATILTYLFRLNYNFNIFVIWSILHNT